MNSMKHNIILTVTSLLSIVLFSIHVTDDIVRGLSEGGGENYIVVLIMVVYLCGTLVVPERALGKIIMLLGGLAAAAIPYLHIRGASHSGHIASSSGGFLFIWTVLALGTTGTFSVILSLDGLRRPAARPDMIAVENASADRRG